jgi:hypothetical protein
MKTTTNPSIAIAFLIVTAALALFGGRMMTAGVMQGGVYDTAWITAHGWMWVPAFFALALAVVLGWLTFKKRV